MKKGEQAAIRADEIVPVDVSHEATTVEIPAFPIPHNARRDEITVPVQWSLESLLEQELLRRQSANKDEARADTDEPPADTDEPLSDDAPVNADEPLSDE